MVTKSALFLVHYLNSILLSISNFTDLLFILLDIRSVFEWGIKQTLDRNVNCILMMNEKTEKTQKWKLSNSHVSPLEKDHY